MKRPEALSPEEVTKLDAAIENLKESGQRFVGSHKTQEVQLFLAYLELAETQATLLKALPGALMAVHHSVEAERL